MASRRQLVDLDFGSQAKVTGLPTPTAPSDAVNKAYADALGGGGGGTTILTTEVDVGPTPVRSAKFTILDELVTPTTKIIANQAGRAATGRAADENEMTRLHVVVYPKTGEFDLWIDCLNGTMTGRFLIDYVKG